ncbi:6,7-dimethyl-8-ribityllumazine synthase [Sneathiella chinensis]|uniref:6,7-dimethyl-8-ribityllumazine synthase n=1 Tax=Sneathiella chinensis TaxID=349750 RepID=A0ABQ5UBR7_9PROT|nr:6,7-dimethyl-8-ribityllumazine synthase [Sneathiella chinensis]GLQ08006.1 6,7-dimethyl-8-ribityllumazine synthase [Sneathiella chinensis]
MTNHVTGSQETLSPVKSSNPEIAVIQANWHIDIVSQATNSFTDDLEAAGINRRAISVFDVPGSLEIPLMAQKLAETGRYDLIMATGLIVDGGIYRHDFVAGTVLDAMMRVQLDTGVPVLSVVLTPHNFQEVPAHMDFFREHFVLKGKEAANACLQTLSNMALFSEEKRLAS